MKTFYSQTSLAIRSGFHHSFGQKTFYSDGWQDFDIVLKAETKEEARKKIWKWARSKGAIQRQIYFCDKEMFYNDLCGEITYINKKKGKQVKCGESLFTR